jgi:hypothetical protein
MGKDNLDHEYDPLALFDARVEIKYVMNWMHGIFERARTLKTQESTTIDGQVFYTTSIQHMDGTLFNLGKIADQKYQGDDGLRLSYVGLDTNVTHSFPRHSITMNETKAREYLEQGFTVDYFRKLAVKLGEARRAMG